jgi:hypothetical protein
MTTDALLLNENLKDIETGAKGFRVLQVIFTVFTALFFIATMLSVVGALGLDGDAAMAMTERAKDFFGSFIESALLVWLARLSGNAFSSIAALTRENAGLV